MEERPRTHPPRRHPQEGERPRRPRTAHGGAGAPRPRKHSDTRIPPRPRTEHPKQRHGISEERIPRRPRPAHAAGSSKPRRPHQDSHVRRPIAPPTRHRPPMRRKPKPQSLFSRILRKLLFPVLLVIYVFVFIAVVSKVAGKVEVYMAEYETSQPQYAVDGFMDRIGNDFFSQMLMETLNETEHSDYETAALLYDNLYAGEPKDGYSCRKKDGVWTETNPIYEICSEGSTLAEMTLIAPEQTATHQFPIWQVGDVRSLLMIESKPAYTLSVVMPADATLTVNGIPVPATALTEAEPEVMLDDVAQKHGEQPKRVRFSETGLYLCPEISITDSEGNQLVPLIQPKKNQAEQVYEFQHCDVPQPDEALVERVKNLTRAYVNYVSNNGRDGRSNLAVLNQYLVSGSPAAKVMSTIITDIYWNNQYEARNDRQFEVTHVKQYSDTLCTCELAFDIVLSKVVTNEYKGSIRWVMVKTDYGWFATDFTLMLPQE